MAKVKISDLDDAATLDGTELVELEQDGGSVKCTTQDIADFGKIEITGTITGADPESINIFATPANTGVVAEASVILKCTDAGAGAVIVNDCALYKWASIIISNGEVLESLDNNAADDSMSLTEFSLTVAAGNLVLTIQPPLDGQSASDSEFSYKIRISGFSL